MNRDDGACRIVPAAGVTSGGARWPTAILHLDLDAFFVGVHFLDHPEDRGQRVAVGGSPSGRGVVTSASYEARAFGIRAGMPAAQALRACPGLKLVGADWARIRDCSAHVMDVLARFGPCEPVSVDEAYVDLGAAPDPALLAVAIDADDDLAAAATALWRAHWPAGRPVRLIGVGDLEAPGTRQLALDLG